MERKTDKILLETRDLCRNFGALKATDQVNLQIYEGEMHAIIGPNGAGKSTLMDLFPALTCFENIRIALIKRKGKTYDFLPKKKSYLREECREILKLVGMEEKMDDTAALLSYGDQRRLEIAVTLAMEPILLMLDEPTAGVARAEGYEIMKMIRRLAGQRQITVVFIEHDMDIVFHYSDRISVLSQGALIVTDEPQRVRENQFVKEAYFGGAQV